MKTKIASFIFLVAISTILNTMPFYAQSNTIIALQSDVTAVETGQYYTVTMIIQDVSAVWQINAEIEYDPALVYVVGTISGLPMMAGDFFGDAPNIIIRNNINAGKIIYTQSLVAPADPIGGSGTVATFQIYPLSAGTTQMQFSAADLTTVNFTEGADGRRIVENTEDLPVVPALLELSISGDTVEPPDEATPTPEPTATGDLVGRGGDPSIEATLINVTLAPDAMPTLIPDPIMSDSNGLASALPIAIGLLAVGIMGVIVLLVVSRRR